MMLTSEKNRTTIVMIYQTIANKPYGVTREHFWMRSERQKDQQAVNVRSFHLHLEQKVIANSFPLKNRSHLSGQ